jgi:hypothetical protein
MTWIRLDDGFISHPKTLVLPHKTIVLHIAGLSYCCTQLTDGRIPKSALPLVLAIARVQKGAMAPLLDSEMWLDQGDHYEIHGFLDYQESREVVLKRREKWAAKKATQREMSKGESLGDTPGDSKGESHAPDPTRPVNTLTPVDGSKPEPDGFGEWWTRYPRKEAKGRAEKAYRTALKAATREELADGLERSLAAWRAKGTQPQYYPHPTTWLNGKCWLDEAPKTVAAPAGQVVNGVRESPFMNRYQ